MCCKNVNKRYSEEELNKIARRAKDWVNSPEGKVAMKEARKRFDDYVTMEKREREKKSSVDIYKPFMAA